MKYAGSFSIECNLDTVLAFENSDINYKYIRIFDRSGSHGK